MGDQDADVLVKGANRFLMILFVDLATDTVAEFFSKDSLYHAPAQRSRDEPAAVIDLLVNRTVFFIAGKGIPTPLLFGLLKAFVILNRLLNGCFDFRY